LVIEISLYYAERSKEHQIYITSVPHLTNTN
jgi:hypothetical protein